MNEVGRVEGLSYEDGSLVLNVRLDDVERAGIDLLGDAIHIEGVLSVQGPDMDRLMRILDPDVDVDPREVVPPADAPEGYPMVSLDPDEDDDEEGEVA